MVTFEDDLKEVSEPRILYEEEILGQKEELVQTPGSPHLIYLKALNYWAQFNQNSWCVDQNGLAPLLPVQEV